MKRAALLLVVAGVALLVSGAAAQAVSTVPLTVTIKGAGTVKVTNKAPVSCKSSCHVTLQVAVGSTVTVVPKPTALWKLAPFSGACKGVAPKCSFRATRAASVGVTFLQPGVRANPIPLGTAWKLTGNWTFKIKSTTPSAQLTNYSGKPQLAPPGAQYFLAYIEATYTGGGSAGSTILSEGFGAAGSHNASYEFNDLRGCGPGEAQLPAPDLQVKFENSEQVYSGQTIAGNICFQIAANDASSLLFVFHTYTATAGQLAQTWFALR